MSPRRTTPAPSNPPPTQNLTPNRPTQRTPTNNTKRPTQKPMWAFLTRTPSAATHALRDDHQTTEPEASQTTVHTTALDNTPMEQQPEPFLPTPPIQRVLNCDLSNAPWGDYVHYNKPHNHFRILSKNVSTLNTQNLDMTAIASELQHCDASAFLAQETNIPWKPTNLQSIRSQCQQIHRHLKMATSSSTDSTTGQFQPGGTLTLALGKWASRVIQWGSDDPLGRWSYLELVGQQGMRLIIVSAYRVCPQQFDPTTSTVTAQQTRILLQQGVPNPNLRKLFITDLVTQINSWRNQHKEVLVGLDANENVDDPRSKIMRLLAETDLIDLHQHRYPALKKPATHQRGSHPIDLIIGSPRLASALINAWILPFGDPPLIKGDHRLLGLDFNAELLFGSKPNQPSPGLLRGVNSRHEELVFKFSTQVVQQCNSQHLAERATALLDKTTLDDTDLMELENIDNTLTTILTKADQKW